MKFSSYIMFALLTMGNKTPVVARLRHHTDTDTDDDKSKSRVVTIWWIIFNNPDACTGGYEDSGLKCGLSDVIGAAQSGTNSPKIAVFHATGGVADKRGKLRLTATLYKTQSPLDLVSDSDEHYLWGGPPPLYAQENNSIGYSPEDGVDAEVHVVFHDHGAPAKGEKLLKQLTRFNDPLCIQNGGAKTCVDVGVAAFPIMTSDGDTTVDVSGFPLFPEGCAEAGECTKIQEDVQLSAGEGNSAYLVRSGGGDSLQLVADILLPEAKRI